MTNYTPDEFDQMVLVYLHLHDKSPQHAWEFYALVDDIFNLPNAMVDALIARNDDTIYQDIEDWIRAGKTLEEVEHNLEWLTK